MLLTSFGTLGDVLPFVGVGAELARRGHDVTVLTHRRFADLVDGAGLDFVAIGCRRRYRRAVDDPDLWHPTRGLKTVMNRLLPDPLVGYEAVMDHAGDDTVAITHPFAFGSHLARDRHGIDCATLVLSPCLLRSRRRVPVMYGDRELSQMARPIKQLMWWLADRILIDPATTPRLHRACRRLGLPPVQRPFDGWIHSDQLTIGLFPPWFAPPQPDWPDSVELTGFSLYFPATDVPAPVAAFVDAGSPPLVATTASATVDGNDFVAPIVRACRATGDRALFLGTDPAVSLPDSDQFLAADFAPLDRVLPHCRALIHHGGVGTTAAGIRAAIPQLVRPVAHDHPDQAARIQRLGIGARLLADEFTAPALVEHLDPIDGALADDGLRRRCRRRARQVYNNNGLHDACTLIEETFVPGVGDHHRL